MEIEKIKQILIGIDETELESVNGWWEASAGREFGKQVLTSLINYLMPFSVELETLRASNTIKQANIERLEAENETLEEKLQEQLCTVGSLLVENAKLIAERGQQIPEGYALEILRKVFDLYESGVDCYDSEDHYSAAYLGKCIRLDDNLFKSCVDLLSASQPKGDV